MSVFFCFNPLTFFMRPSTLLIITEPNTLEPLMQITKLI